MQIIVSAVGARAPEFLPSARSNQGVLPVAVISSELTIYVELLIKIYRAGRKNF